ncbi:MAG: DUF4998 domain-containing protein [Paludibacteraceae bacterium]
MPQRFSGIVYGDVYESSLQNRNIEAVVINQTAKNILVRFPVLNDSTNFGTEIRWTQNGQTNSQFYANTSDDQITVENCEVKDFEYRNYYKPARNAIDTFYSAWKPYHITTIVKTLLNRDSWTVTTSHALPSDAAGNYIKILPTATTIHLCH